MQQGTPKEVHSTAPCADRAPDQLRLYTSTKETWKDTDFLKKHLKNLKELFKTAVHIIFVKLVDVVNLAKPMREGRGSKTWREVQARNCFCLTVPTENKGSLQLPPLHLSALTHFWTAVLTPHSASVKSEPAQGLTSKKQAEQNLACEIVHSQN